MIHSRATLVHAEVPRSLCSVDPVTLTGLALAGLAGGAATAAASGAFGGGKSPTPATPAPPPSAPAPQQSPQAKPVGATNQPSFLGAAATPALGQPSGQKTLLGQ